jgi:hypothetical protein
MQLHDANEQQPMMKFVGRERERERYLDRGRKEKGTRNPTFGHGRMTSSPRILISTALERSPAFLSLLRSPV